MTHYGSRPVAAVLLALWMSPVAMGQARVQFPAVLGDATVPPPHTAGSGTVNFSPASQLGAPQPVYGPPAGGAPGHPAPNYAVPPNYAPTPSHGGGSVFGQPGAPVNPLAPSLGPQAAPVGSIPGAQFSGTIQPPPATWDPYAPPGSFPPSLMPQDPHFPYNTPAFSTTGALRFLQEVRFDYVWLAGRGANELGIHEAEIFGTFALPFFHNTQTPLLVTPGFAVHVWEEPVRTLDRPVLFDAYLEGAWNPQVTPMFGGELAFQVGVHSDFKHIDRHSIRYQGKGLAVLALSPNMKVKAGVWYIDRNRVKLLPAGGFVWTPQGPDGNVVLEVLFPNPRIAFRLADYHSTEWWLYGRGEYGGGAWTVKRWDTGGPDRLDYNDIRAAAGLEFLRPRLSGLFEVGVAFEREIFFVNDPAPVPHPHPTVFLRGSVAF